MALSVQEVISITRQEVGDQPAVLARVFKELDGQVSDLAKQMAARKTSRVVTLGSGDSWFAAQIVPLAFQRYAGIASETFQAYEYAIFGQNNIDAQTTIFVMSSSGRPTTTWDALDRALATPALTVGVSDKRYDGNPFIEKPLVALVPGAVKVGMPAQTTNVTAALLVKLAILLGRERGHLSAAEAGKLLDELHGLPEKVEKVLKDAYAWAKPIAESLKGRRYYTFVGGGPSYAAAQNASGMLAYVAHLPAMPLEVEEFHHAYRASVLDPGDPVVIVAPSGDTDKRSDDTVKAAVAANARPLLIATSKTASLYNREVLVLPDVSEPMSAILTLPALHAFTVEVATVRFG